MKIWMIKNLFKFDAFRETFRTLYMLNKNKKLNDFKRTNGIKGDTDKEYMVSYTATVTFKKSILEGFKPKLDDAIKEQKDALAELDASWKKMEEDNKAAIAPVVNEYNSSDRSAIAYNREQDKLDDLKKKYTETANKISNSSSDVRTILRNKIAQIEQDASKKLSSGCDNANRFHMTSKDIEKSRDETFVFTATQKFIKTENGWVLNL